MSNIIRIDLKTANCYLVKTVDGFVLVDTGGFTFNDRPLSSRQELLEEKLLANGCVPGTLKLVVLTHGDVDHIANCKFLREKYGTKIVIHKDDSDLLTNLTIEKIFSNFKFQSIAYKAISLLMHSIFVKIANGIIKKYAEFDADELIDDKYDLKKYNLDAQIIHVPGHTKGSIGILTSDGDFICGDIFANTNKPSIALNALSFKDLKNSIDRLPSEKINIVYPGHGEPFEYRKFKRRRQLTSSST